MTHPFPAEHDQQQAEALDILKKAEAFVLVHFPESDETCDHPFCAIAHRHHTTQVIASCSTRDLQAAMTALAEELMVTAAIDTLMHLAPAQRDQVASMLREEGAFLRLRDEDEA